MATTGPEGKEKGKRYIKKSYWAETENKEKGEEKNLEKGRREIIGNGNDENRGNEKRKKIDKKMI